MGEIADRIRDFIPATYDALTSATSTFGSTSVDRIVESVKYRLFGTVVSASLEATLYNPFALDYAAKVATLKIIPPGTDYWSDQLQSETTNEETISYPDRSTALWKIHDRLLLEVRMDESAFERLFPPTTVRGGAKGLPKVSTEGEFMTPDPDDWGGGSTGKNFGNPLKSPLTWEIPE